MNLRGNKGIGLSDAIIAIAIFVIFSGIIISISYNIYLQSNFIKRNDTATNYIIEVLEHAQTLDLASIEDELEENETLDKKVEEILIDFINERSGDIISATKNEVTNIAKGYIMHISVNDINSIDQEKYDKGHILQIDVIVYYKLGGKNKTISMNTLLTK